MTGNSGHFAYRVNYRAVPIGPHRAEIFLYLKTYWAMYDPLFPLIIQYEHGLN